MRKALLPLAFAGVLPITSVADVSIYGRAHVSLDWLDNGADYSEPNVSSNSSLLGFKGSRTFGNGLTALFQLERLIDIDSGEANAGPRDTFIGLSGDFGMVRVGYFDTPFKRARLPANLFGDQVGDMRNITRAGNGRFDERTPNTVHYQTPKLGDFQFNVTYSLYERHIDGESGEVLNDDVISLSLTYVAGALDIAAAYEAHGQDRTLGERSGARLAAGYRVSPELRLVGFFQSLDHEMSDEWSSETIGAGAEYRLTELTTLRGQYLIRNSDMDDAGSNLFTVGIEQRLDQAVRLYANYAVMSNDDNAQLTPYTQARSTGNVPRIPGETTSGLSAGLIYSF